VTLRSAGGNPASGSFDVTDPTSLGGAVALITGGASGLGLATATTLVAAGAHVVLADRDVDRGEAAAKELDCAFTACDVTRPEDSTAAVAFATSTFGHLDLAVLNAGIEGGGPIGEGFDLARYRAVMSVNADGVAFGMSAALPAVAATGGAIVAIASLAGLTAMPMDPVYAASKHAVVGLVRALGMAAAPQGVTVNGICPGFADTPLIAAFRSMFVERGFPLLEASEVATAIVSAALSQGTGECWVVQPGREPAPYGFRGVPGARTPDGRPASLF
jgi:NAD(P)-dependent dehydrogenase (short-subunit alcohol dehydrogenase family)